MGTPLLGPCHELAEFWRQIIYTASFEFTAASEFTTDVIGSTDASVFPVSVLRSATDGATATISATATTTATSTTTAIPTADPANAAADAARTEWSTTYARLLPTTGRGSAATVDCFTATAVSASGSIFRTTTDTSADAVGSCKRYHGH